MEVDLITSWKDHVLADMDNKTEKDYENERGTEYIALESSFIQELWTPDIIFSKKHIHTSIFLKQTKTRVCGKPVNMH